jgi:hypothetical protein
VCRVCFGTILKMAMANAQKSLRGEVGVRVCSNTENGNYDIPTSDVGGVRVGFGQLRAG